MLVSVATNIARWGSISGNAREAASKQDTDTTGESNAQGQLRRDTAMKVLQACSAEEIHTVWTGTIKRLSYRYLEHRNKGRALRRSSAENKLVAPYEGRRWCDATERELIGDITNSYGSHL